jgi:hypothetical protein
MARRILTIEQINHLDRVMRFAENNQEWLNEQLEPMLTLPEQLIETATVWNGVNIDPMRYSRLYFQGKSYGRASIYRSTAFLGFHRFNDAKFKDDETFLERRERIVLEVLGRVQTFRLILLTLLETDENPNMLIQDKTYMQKRFKEASIDWLRLSIHQLWVGKWRETISMKPLQEIVAPFGYTIRKATPNEDFTSMFDFVALLDGIEVLGFSCKSPLYRKKYSSTSSHRDGQEGRETQGHALAMEKFGIETVVYVSDHLLFTEENYSNIEADIINAVRNLKGSE